MPSTNDANGAVPLSVVVTTTHPWPQVKGCLERLLPQIQKLGAELIVADSTGRGLPDPCPERYAGVRWLKFRGETVFHVRAQATASATGEVIAWTEDHCLPGADWCAAHVVAHRKQTNAGAVAGIILNGSTATLLDWANYFISYGQFLPPMRAHCITRNPGVANVSFKRWAVAGARPDQGWIELVLPGKLRAAGQMAFNGRAEVAHVQPRSVVEACVGHFDNGRSATGLGTSWMTTGGRWARFGGAFLLPLGLLRTSCRIPLSTPGFRRLFLRSFPWMAVLAVCHTAGEFAGLVTGKAGVSPWRVE